MCPDQRRQLMNQLCHARPINLTHVRSPEFTRFVERVGLLDIRRAGSPPGRRGCSQVGTRSASAQSAGSLGQAAHGRRTLLCAPGSRSRPGRLCAYRFTEAALSCIAERRAARDLLSVCVCVYLSVVALPRPLTQPVARIGFAGFRRHTSWRSRQDVDRDAASRVCLGGLCV